MATLDIADAVEVRETVKARFRIANNDLDTLIDSYVREIGRRIRHYCNIIDIPDDLSDVWASMVMDALRVEQSDVPGIAENVPNNMSVKIGDTSTAPAGSSGEITATNKSVIDAIVLNYKADLHAHRKLRW
ncbi:DNA-packaging protein [Cohnella thailandensis]|uniref:DNA-packaging protein n=1 Tax=Cohnella thailandensis TaxID=557557 RepID=A0A841SQ88_9BACL|nr:DNA-packaging protein [Cohnella thailandensis]MBB6632766.1 DNA-packaging protein [Cohnella thailandensis]MBP1975545.1 hypothetical protein [Cohnella thailandensis]